ncbi:uncharacterized protein [Rutidosis leptorrhynchoides]|uniref:uncharacterized protein n=1 Tax=Rutidosis leptorrhynchoides TaxID=125765 RepID=UPI003A992C28
MTMQPMVDRSLTVREEAFAMLQYHLRRAQDRMKLYADKRMSDRVFIVGNWVYVKLRPYRQITLRGNSFNKLSQKYYGPFMVTRKVGEVAYELKLPSSTRIHPVFHVSQLKLHKGEPPAEMSVIPLVNQDGLLVAEPLKILNRRLMKKGNVASVVVLVQWQVGSEEDATWEAIDDLQLRFPNFPLA